MKKQIEDLLVDASNHQIFSAASALYGDIRDKSSWQKIHVGKHSFDVRSMVVSDQSIYDLASLTKALCTSVLVFKFVESGHIKLDDTLGAFFPDLKADLKKINIQQLLTHTSGLPWWKPFYLSPLTIWKDFELTDPILSQQGVCVYSDLSFLWLQKVLEHVSGVDYFTLSSSLTRGYNVDLGFRPLNIAALRFPDPKVVATEICPYRGHLQGQVHDDNAYALMGVAGHAGWFGTLESVATWLKLMFDGQVLSLEMLQKMLAPIQLKSIQGETVYRTLGWDCPHPSGQGSVAYSPTLVGHLGFTGTSLWLDIRTGQFAVLLTNRVHPKRDRITAWGTSVDAIRRVRRSIYDIVFPCPTC